MSIPPRNADRLPDVADEDSAAQALALDWVGMEGIDLPLVLRLANGQEITVAARLDAAVSLDDAHARGIHMSRLYLDAQTQLRRQALSLLGLRHVLRDFLASHAGLSRHAKLQLRFELLLERPALRSANSGFKRYPVEILAIQRGTQFSAELGVKLLYSSTCPCSAALSRQRTAESFLQRFADTAPDREAVAAWLRSAQGMPATPHAQRSEAELKVRLHDQELDMQALIDGAEQVLGTPVQTAVKREDEQAFAEANASNLMFCEDAARRLAAMLAPQHRQYWLRVRHFESLHAHDAVAVASRGEWAER